MIPVEHITKLVFQRYLWCIKIIFEKCCNFFHKKSPKLVVDRLAFPCKAPPLAHIFTQCYLSLILSSHAYFFKANVKKLEF